MDEKGSALRLREITRGVVCAIADALEAKDEYVYGHARRVSGFASTVGRRLSLEGAKLEEISLAALLHDISVVQLSNGRRAADSRIDASG